MMRNLSIQMKMIIGVICFTLLIVSLERYQFSENIVEQFIASQKSKNRLLIDTISPVISLNASLGLSDANKEYLDRIVEQNGDILSLTLRDNDGKMVYSYVKNNKVHFPARADDIHFFMKRIVDPVTEEYYGKADIYFDDHEYQAVIHKNRVITLQIFIVTFVLLIGFIFLIKREFRYLQKLTENVLRYDPQLNNFGLAKSDRKDEVGIIHNAVVNLVEKIDSYAKLLHETNHSLEEKVALRTKELQDANRQLKELSVTDPLTQLSNRRHFETHLHDVWLLAKRSHLEISVIMCDIDYFKTVNDQFGHLMGDVVLKEIAAILTASLKRSSDFVARYGGEEFIIVLYDTKITAAQELCRTIQHRLKETGSFEYQGAKTEPITMSFGISNMIPGEKNVEEDLIKFADLALYKAKEDGRNRIVLSMD